MGLVPYRCVSMVRGHWSSLPAGGFPAGRLEQLRQVGRARDFAPVMGGLESVVPCWVGDPSSLGPLHIAATCV